MKKKKKKNNIQEDVIKAMRKANREIELERNGGRWIAVNRPYKNKKKYDRKRDSKVDLEPLYFFGNDMQFVSINYRESKVKLVFSFI